MPNPLHFPVGARVSIQNRAGQVERCRVIRLLDQGSKASVYLAELEGGDGAVVLKAASAGRRDAADLEIEQRILEGLSHPNLVRYIGHGVSNGRRVLASERLHTNPLLVLNTPAIRRHFPSDLGSHYHPLPPSVSLALGIDLLRGLEYLHRQGYVHHDVKLGNLLVRPAQPALELDDAALLDQVIAGRSAGVLIDLGGSRSQSYLDDLAAGKVDSSIVPPQLTPAYAPPEALDPDPSRRRMHRSLDVYAAAIVLYTTISGRRPYDHLQLDPDDMQQLLSAKQEERRGALLPCSFEALSGVPGVTAIAAELNGLLSACLHRRPEERPTPGQARKFLEGLHHLFTKGVPRVLPPRSPRTSARDPHLRFGTRPKRRD